jgi:hypothetical protein
MKNVSFLFAFAVTAAAATTVLTACQTTMDARWATNDDTVNRWETVAPSLPIEVRGRLPNATNEQVASAIPNSMTQQSLVNAHDHRASNDPAPRFVLELSNEAPAGDNAYCAHRGSEPADSDTAKPLTVTLSLCDGTRLVARSKSPLESRDAAPEYLNGKIKRLKNLMFIGIADDQAAKIHLPG